MQTAPQTQSPRDLRPAALPEERKAAVVSRSMGRGSTKATVTRFPPRLSIWSLESLTEAFEAVFFLHAESKTQQSHISYYFMSFIQNTSKISIQKESEHPQKCRGWYVWARMQRRTKSTRQYL